MRSRVYVTVGRPSVRLSVCLINRQQQRRPVGLLLSAGVCNIYLPIAASAVLLVQRRRSAVNADSVMLTAAGGSGVNPNIYIGPIYISVSYTHLTLPTIYSV